MTGGNKEPRIGTAGWAIRREHGPLYDPGPSHLARYATRFNAVEINSSFYRAHRRATYERWAASVPAGFRFAVKAPKAITHVARCADCDEALDTFLHEVAGLGAALGPILFQFPPSFAFAAPAMRKFCGGLRKRFGGDVVCEPRHASWFTAAAETLLRDMRVARVAADPAPIVGAAEPGGWDHIQYWRLHGSPRMYYSAYDDAYLLRLVERLARQPDAWCIFDNTARGAAVENALALSRMLEALNR